MPDGLLNANADDPILLHFATNMRDYWQLDPFAPCEAPPVGDSASAVLKLSGWLQNLGENGLTRATNLELVDAIPTDGDAVDKDVLHAERFLRRVRNR